MIYNITVSPVAFDEISNIAEYITKANCKSIADKVVSRIYETIDSLMLYAKLGNSVKDRFDIESDYKFVVALPYPYLIFYKIQSLEIIIGHVIDGRRDYIQMLGI
jgi:plasmid stabilization system protein ParE